MRSDASLLLAFALACVGGCGPKTRPPVCIAVTQGVTATGVVPQLVSTFHSYSGATGDIHQVAGTSPTVGEKTCDMVITDDEEVVRKVRIQRPPKLVAVFARNDFYIVGPRSDPARIRRASSAVDAFQRIARKGARFDSAADEPSIDKREDLVWRESKIFPGELRRYRRLKGPARDVLVSAAANGAYTLTDRATYEEVNPADSEVLFSGSPLLAHRFTALLLETGDGSEDAAWFTEWLMSYRGREAIESLEPHRVFLP